MIPFNIPLVSGREIEYIKDVIHRRSFCGDGFYTRKVNRWIEENTKALKAYMTTSCTHALEMAAMLFNIKEGDEVIMPSFTFVSTANAFVLRGAKIIFIDIRPDTMNIDELKIEEAITEKTKLIVPVHYGGVGCEMDKIMQIAERYNLYVVEDAAQGVMSEYKAKALGTIGHIGCYSFHDTKNYNCGEGGAILINNEKFINKAEIIWEKGTNRRSFLRGEIDKYTWIDIGSSYLPSELNAAFIYAQLIEARKVNEHRLRLWKEYYRLLLPLSQKRIIELPTIPEECKHNAHLFYIKVKDINERQKLINYLKKNNIQAVFHYIPLHSSPAGKIFGKFFGKDIYTTKESERLLRLPMFYDLKIEEVNYICDRIKSFYCEN